MDTFGSRLRAARKARGITQETLGFELDVTKATVSKWETGRSEPTLRQLGLLAEFLGRDANYFLRLDTGLGEAHAMLDTSRVMNADEEKFLIRFRALSPARRRGLLAFLLPEA